MSTVTSTYRVNYSDYVADITGSPKATVKSAHTGVSQLSHPFLNRQSQGNQQTGVMPQYGGGAEKCARCSKNVYLAEKKVGAGRSFHSRCFSCQTCHRKLDASTLSEHKGEIFCKTCYTRQYGMHGLVSGVTMTTEHSTRESRPSRRSSYGSDLDAPVITHQQTRQRAHSNDNLLRGENSAIHHDELPKMFPWRNDVLPEQRSPPTNQINIGHDHIVDKQHPRPTSQIGFERVIETTINQKNSYQSSYSREDSRDEHVFENGKTSHSNGTTAIIDMPLISPPKRFDSAIAMPTRNNDRSRSPSPTTADAYRRQSSREHHTDISDNFSRLTLNENQKYSNDNISTNGLVSDNPLLKRTYSPSPTYENKIMIPSNTNHSRDSSPSATGHSNRSPSPTSGYASSSVHGGVLRDSTSPPSAFVPQHDPLNIRSSNSSVIDRKHEHTSSALHDFVSKTNNLPSPQPTNGKYSTLGALIKPHRPLSQHNNRTDDDDDGFDN